VSAGVLLVGAGRRGRQWGAAAEEHLGLSLAGVVDPDRAARAPAEERGVPAWATLEDALREAGANTAIITTPPALHAEQAIACLRAGLAVLVEKPLALSLADATAVADAAERAGRAAVVGHNFRHRPLERALRRALDEDAVGELRVATIATARPPAALGYDHAPLWDLGVHHLDLLRLRFGGPPDCVEARHRQSAGGVTYSLHLEWDRGATADYWLREGASVYHHAEWLEGEAGALRVVDGRAWHVTTTRRPRRLRPPRGPEPERVLLDALLGGDHHAVDARESLGTVATVEAAIRSLALERPVRLSELTAAPAEVTR
jgi:predicted dehydrogenase